MALYVLLLVLQKTYWHFMPYLPALHVCDILIGTAFMTTGIPGIHMQLIN